MTAVAAPAPPAAVFRGRMYVGTSRVGLGVRPASSGFVGVSIRFVFRLDIYSLAGFVHGIGHGSFSADSLLCRGQAISEGPLGKVSSGKLQLSYAPQRGGGCGGGGGLWGAGRETHFLHTAVFFVDWERYIRRLFFTGTIDL